MPRIRMDWAIALLCITLLTWLAGCAQRSEESSTQAVAPSTSAGAPTAGADAGKPMSILLVPKGTEHSFWQTVIKGAKDAAQEAGATLDWKGPASEQDVAGQITIIENAMQRDLDAIVMAACDANDLIKPLQRAKEKGILIAVIDSGINDDEIPVTYAATDNVLGGQKAAQALMELIGPEGGKVAVIPFIAGAKSSDERQKGFVDEIRKHPEFKLLEPLYSQSQVDTAMNVTTNLLQANPDLKGIFAANEPGAIGAARVLEQMGKAGQVKLVGFDAAASEVEALQKGTIQALVVQNPYKMGYEGVMAVVRAARGEAVEPRIDTGVTVVTPDNLSDPEIKELVESQVG